MRSLSALLWGVAVVYAVAPLHAQEPQLLGSNVCASCHADIAGPFNTNPHFTPPTPGAPEQLGCESCHGPGSAHVAGGGDVTAIARFDLLEPDVVLNRCLQCHNDDLGKMRIRHSSHSTAEVSCVSCHTIHKEPEGGPLLDKQEREVCYTCHLEIRARFDLPFKHRVNEGAVQCSDCHNPHEAPTSTWASAGSRSMVRHAFGNDIACVNCHTDKRGPFVHEHPPVRVDGCQTCHNPHGSTNPRLLSRPAAFTICLECHNGAGTLGTRAEGIPNPTVGFHNIASPQFQNCVTCHARIHGSNVDPLFRR